MAATRAPNGIAQRINRDARAYGAFAEIGGGQECSRWFFHVGGAAGTVAKTISAYDPALSSAIYGHADRFVSPERLAAMLDHEYGLLARRLGPERGGHTMFFAFANTVATMSHQGGNECHGWMGVRFQEAPGAEPSDVIVHASLRDPTAAQQQVVLGILGVNLIHSALYQRRSRRELLGPLLDGLSMASAEIDVARFAGRAFEGFGSAADVAADLLTLGLTPVVSFGEGGSMDQCSTIVHKRPLLLHRCSATRKNPELDRDMAAGAAALRAEAPEPERPPLPVLELSLSHVLGQEHEPDDGAAKRIESLIRPGTALMATTYAETYNLTNYLRRYSRERLRFVVGLDLVVQMLREHFYKRIDGGMLEGLGRLLSADTRVYVCAMSAKTRASGFGSTRRRKASAHSQTSRRSRSRTSPWPRPRGDCWNTCESRVGSHRWTQPAESCRIDGGPRGQRSGQNAEMPPEGLEPSTR